MCRHQLIYSEYNTSICTNCGIETTTSIEPSTLFYTVNQPLWVGYNRVNRFRKILNMLFHPKFFAVISGEIFLKMKEFKQFDTVSSMIACLKSLNSKSKNYNSLHLYAIHFVENFSSPSPPMTYIIHNMLADFVILEKGLHVHFKNSRFFSYRWLIIKMLLKYSLEVFIPLVKPLINKTSSMKYERMYKKIMTEDKHLLVQDIQKGSEKRLVPQLDGDCGSPFFGCGVSHRVKRLLHSFALEELYQTAHKKPGS